MNTPKARAKISKKHKKASAASTESKAVNEDEKLKRKFEKVSRLSNLIPAILNATEEENVRQMRYYSTISVPEINEHKFKVKKGKKFVKVNKVIDALEKDLATNFATGYLTKSLTSFGKYMSLVVVAMYLLPRCASMQALKKFIFTHMVDETKTARNKVTTAVNSLVAMKLVERKVGKFILCKDFRQNLDCPVKLHDKNKLIRFQAKFMDRKMTSWRVSAKVLKGAESKKKPDLKEKKKSGTLCPAAIRALEELTGESQMNAEKQEKTFKMDQSEVNLGDVIKIE